MTRKPRSVRSTRNGAPRRLRPVDEEVGELPVVGRRARARSPGMSSKSDRFELVDARAGRRRRRAVRAAIARVVDRRTAAASGLRSILLRTTICGRSSSPAPYAASSASIVRQRSSASSSDASITWSEQARALEMREELVAEPYALARAFDQPRDVGDDELAPVGRSTVPSTGCKRRERIVGDLRRRVRDARRSDDFPAFGKPRSAASAISLSRSSISPSSPGSPGSAKRGACRVGRGEALVAAPARAAPWRRRRARPPARGRRSSRPSRVEDLRPDRNARARRPRRRAPCRGAARRARPRAGAEAPVRRGTSERSRSRGSATSTTSPPRPPSPPSGPPLGTYFSRRKLIAPSPPRPPPRGRARSWNTVGLRSEHVASCVALDRPR